MQNVHILFIKNAINANLNDYPLQNDQPMRPSHLKNPKTFNTLSPLYSTRKYFCWEIITRMTFAQKYPNDERSK